MALPKGSLYFGRITITFKLKSLPEIDKNLFLDYYGRSINDLKINGIKISQNAQNSSYNNGTIDLTKGNALKIGINIVSLNFINEYRRDGHGFHSFLDQVDN